MHSPGPSNEQLDILVDTQCNRALEELIAGRVPGASRRHVVFENLCLIMRMVHVPISIRPNPKSEASEDTVFYGWRRSLFTCTAIIMTTATAYRPREKAIVDITALVVIIFTPVSLRKINKQP
jgi:hypothetical protein